MYTLLKKVHWQIVISQRMKEKHDQNYYWFLPFNVNLFQIIKAIGSANNLF